MKKSTIPALIGALAILLCLTMCCHGQPFKGTTYSVTAQWDPSPATNVTNYTVYVSTNTFYPGGVQMIQSNALAFSAGTNLTVLCTNLILGVTYYFVATAENSQGYESDYSNEVVYVANKPPKPHLIKP